MLIIFSYIFFIREYFNGLVIFGGKDIIIEVKLL